MDIERGLEWWATLSREDKARWLQCAATPDEIDADLTSPDPDVRAAAGIAAVGDAWIAFQAAASHAAPGREWIIQRCINAYRNEYEDWPGYSERLLTKPEMMTALEACENRWPGHEFRGHNVVNQRPGRDRLRAVQ